MYEVDEERTSWRALEGVGGTWKNGKNKGVREGGRESLRAARGE
jgi:hypothetical protein